MVVMACVRTTLARGAVCQVDQCACGTLHVSLGTLTLRLAPDVIADVAETLDGALITLAKRTRTSSSSISTPPPPHDPRERDLGHVVGEWEVRIFADAKFQYFVERGLWHVQLWHPKAGVSVLTPSRLTNDAYEIYPARGWKVRASTPVEVARLVADEHAVRFLGEEALREVERAFVAAPIEFSESSRGAS